MKRIHIILYLFIAAVGSLFAQEANYDEAKVPAFVLSPLLMNEEGERITTAKEWERTCRPEILGMLQDQMYGITPTDEVDVRYEEMAVNPQAFGGKATCRQVKIVFTRKFVEREMQLLMYLPNRTKKKVPLFFGLNFKGNQTIAEAEDIIPTTDAPRGSDKSSWSVDRILDAGYGLATACYQDIFPDSLRGHRASVLRLFGYASSDDIKDNDPQAISSWAWGMSRVMDYLETVPEVDASKVILLGHSRIGKAALWAGAQDERFAVVVSNNTGCGGAALSKRKYGETIGIITKKFPHWFCKNYSKYSDNEQSLAFDQHELLALIAPRPLYVTSGEDDRWADPKGEFLGAAYASEVYSLYGHEGLDKDRMPGVNQPVMNRVGYHIRSGKHAVTDYDWEQFIRFADKWLK
ncbi:acetylxylan esterase [Parabacteroides sp. OttesenSCG-928-G06]|nr:acetylxylan esterase [Parabacteroides sp. OttesenSCG-928-G06]